MSYHHLTISECERILLLLYNNKDVTQIAKAINRSTSCIIRGNFSRNTESGYSAYEVQN